MRLVVPVAVFLALASCSSSTPEPSASAAPTPTVASPSATLSTAGSRGLVLAVRRSEHEGLWLYRVDESRRARQVGSIDGPAGQRPEWMTLSAGTRPLVCSVWASDVDDADPVWCYRVDDLRGWALPVEGEAQGVAVRPDGEAVAWEATIDPGDPDTTRDELVVASLDGERTRDQRRFVSQDVGDPPSGTRPLGCSDTAGAISWKDEDELIVQAWGDNDFPGESVQHSVAAGPDGVEPACREIPERHDGTYNYFTRPVAFDGRSFLAVEGEWCEIECPHKGKPTPRRAVLVDLRTGRVLEVIATPAAGRGVTAVTGGTHGVVYVTQGSNDTRVYLRWPGEKHGTPVVGLPVDLDWLVAQP